ncbi:hypothetical protein MKY09_08065 [Psychrobacillus sp. FSL K6-4046]|uniref:hypothetical protein n=1 Tax=Psychrobacillus sp. FSL K6-4046 TaxID=2921550 RepID=UPI00315A7C8A
MSIQRKKVILNEIAFWKQNKLLPEHYCDFLTALYAQGEGEGTKGTNEGILAKEAKKSKLKVISTTSIISLITLALLGSLVFITTAIIIPIILSGIAILVFTYISIKKFSQSSILSPLLLVFSALLLLGITFKIWEAFFITEPTTLVIMIAVNCILWLFSGLRLKLIYFTISGIVGLLLIFIYISITFFT